VWAFSLLELIHHVRVSAASSFRQRSPLRRLRCWFLLHHRYFFLSLVVSLTALAHFFVCKAEANGEPVCWIVFLELSCYRALLASRGGAGFKGVF
jgi:hypothetical protein